jgi:hypothetical protein
MTDCRISALDFDIAASAGWYSAIAGLLAGLLAGFALLAILLPLDHDSELGSDDPAVCPAASGSTWRSPQRP